MPKYYCDYCDCYLVSSSIAVRKQHNNGAKHKANVKAYYLQFVQEKTQKTIDETIKNFEAMRKSGMIPGRGMMPGMPGMVRRTASPPGVPPAPTHLPPRLQAAAAGVASPASPGAVPELTACRRLRAATGHGCGPRGRAPRDGDAAHDAWDAWNADDGDGRPAAGGHGGPAARCDGRAPRHGCCRAAGIGRAASRSGTARCQLRGVCSNRLHCCCFCYVSVVISYHCLSASPSTSGSTSDSCSTV